ncbi:Translin [Staphylothermus marinus F1]|uniref:Translin n=1 Tax=Staphylothermus marinus (strain ATCC 43588 / DSM 3639 / JCM 9404 / F1) TaxID=399550 RepID=A3DM55_STAMF|nr:haloacid dehalogenase [Staphylothermus marinus]ABN69715.1 Translin [Staphylothermus marinus F1]
MVLEDVVEKVLANDILFIDNVLKKKDEVREEAIRITRDILRYSTEAVRLIHLGKYEEAWKNISMARELIVDLRELLADHPDLYYSGLIYNSLSEYAESYITYKLIVDREMPSYKEVGIPHIPYLQGLGDVVGELRRHVLSLLGNGEIEEAMEYLEVMETIYLWLRKLNYPDPLTPGLRHKVDVARRLVDDTKVLLINTRNAYMVSRKIDEALKTKD